MRQTGSPLKAHLWENTLHWNHGLLAVRKATDTIRHDLHAYSSFSLLPTSDRFAEASPKCLPSQDSQRRCAFRDVQRHKRRAERRISAIVPVRNQLLALSLTRCVIGSQGMGKHRVTVSFDAAGRYRLREERGSRARGREKSMTFASIHDPPNCSLFHASSRRTLG